MKNKPTNQPQPQPAPIQLFSAAEANAFSDALRNIISLTYSNNNITAATGLGALINYFANNYATNEELNFLTLTNDNIVERIVLALRQINPDFAAQLSTAIGGAITSHINNTRALELDLFTDNETSSSENDEDSDVDLFGENSFTDNSNSDTM